MGAEKTEETQDEAMDEATEILDTPHPTNVRKLLPVHAAPYSANPGGLKAGGGKPLKMTRQRGRPRKVELIPTTSDLEYHAEMSSAKESFVQQDPLVRYAENGDSPKLLRLCRQEIAKEASALHFQRIENEKFGRDTATVSSRRIDALTKIAHIELEIRKLSEGSDVIDFKGEKFQKVFKTWIELIKEVALETLAPEMIDLFFNRLATKMEGWEDRASDLTR